MNPDGGEDTKVIGSSVAGVEHHGRPLIEELRFEAPDSGLSIIGFVGFDAAAPGLYRIRNGY